MVTDTRAFAVVRGSSRRARSLACATSLAALAWAAPALAQDQGNLQNSTTAQPAAPQPAVPATANTTSAAQAGQPQDLATAQDASQGNSVGGQGDDIVVVGLRGSLQRNLDIKRDSAGVVTVALTIRAMTLFASLL